MNVQCIIIRIAIYLLSLEPNSVRDSGVQSQLPCQSIDQGAASRQWNYRILISTELRNFMSFTFIPVTSIYISFENNNLRKTMPEVYFQLQVPVN